MVGGEPIETWVVAAVAYGIGGFPTGVLISRLRYGIDVRELGSGNIGATNITRVFGWWAGVLTLVLDALKGYLPLLYLQSRFPGNGWLLAFAAAFLVLGHCFSPYLRLRGGKGVATSLGCMLAVDPRLAALAAAVYGVLLLATRISAIGSLGGIFTAVLYVTVMVPKGRPERYLVYAMAFVVVVRHRSNLVRLWKTFVSRREK